LGPESESFRFLDDSLLALKIQRRGDEEDESFGHVGGSLGDAGRW
jgi:hypothetical protein